MDEKYRLLKALGPLPDENEDIADGVLERFEEIISSLPPPKNAQEAEALAQAFPKEACFGAEWTIIHLIEKTPNWPLANIIESCPSRFKMMLSERSGIDSNN